MSITSVVNTPSNEIASKTFVASTYATITSLSNYALTSSLSDYWKNDGSSTATADWDLGTYCLDAYDIRTKTYFSFADEYGTLAIMQWSSDRISFYSDSILTAVEVSTLYASSFSSPTGILTSLDTQIQFSYGYGPILTDEVGGYWRIQVDSSGTLSTYAI